MKQLRVDYDDEFVKAITRRGEYKMKYPHLYHRPVVQDDREAERIICEEVKRNDHGRRVAGADNCCPNCGTYRTFISPMGNPRKSSR